MPIGGDHLKVSSKLARMLSIATLGVPLVAQTQIGGGTCSSSTLNGAYALTLSGRQVNNSGTFLGVLQATGIATFDGLSNVMFAGAANTNQAVPAPALNWSGTYSVQSNCQAVVTITSGGNVTLSVVIYSQGKDFLLTGSDTTYSYTATGIAQPSPTPACSASTLNGVYTFNATGFVLSNNAVSGAAGGVGLLQFDGQGNLTANLSTATNGAAPSAGTLTGSYTISPGCTGTAALTDSNSHSIPMSFSIYSVAATDTNFYASLARSGKFILIGGGHTAYAQPAAGTCSASSLNGTYSLTLSGRGISGTGAFTGSYQGIGTATFDGMGNVTLAGTVNTNLAQGKPFSYTGTYSLPSNCSGTLTVNITSPVTFDLVVWSSGSQYNIVGSDANYAYSGSGGSAQPPACATATLSGEYSFSASGFTVSGTMQDGAEDESGVMQFDGQGNVTAKYTDSQSSGSQTTAMGTYTMGSGCLASATLTDNANTANALNFVIAGAHGENMDMIAANSQFVRSGTAHSTIANPSQAIVNAASYAYSATTPGSIFALFGLDLATKPGGAVTTNLPTELLSTQVTVNGELAPLFYVDSGQIDAQLPWDIPAGAVASVIVTNGTSASNAAAMYVPATGTPGIFIYATSRAVVTNSDGTINSASAPAAVGDEVVAYFTGGGPVNAAGKLTTGAPSPDGLSMVTGSNSVMVGGSQATVAYMGLTPGSIGLYQANFYVPQLAKGSYPVVITIAGQASNNPVMSISN